jgi:hypothetical protein
MGLGKQVPVGGEIDPVPASELLGKERHGVMTEVETIMSLVRTAKTCDELAGVLRDAVALGKDSCAELRGWLADLAVSRVEEEIGWSLPPKARMLVTPLAQLGYEDLSRLVFLLEEKAAALEAGTVERPAV